MVNAGSMTVTFARDFRAFALSFRIEVIFLDGAFDKTVTPDDDVFRIRDFTRRITRKTRAETHAAGDHNIAGIVIAVMNAACIEQTLQQARGFKRFPVVACASSECDGCVTLFLANRGPLFADFSDGLIPCDALPFTRASLADAAHGVLNSTRAIQALQVR